VTNARDRLSHRLAFPKIIILFREAHGLFYVSVAAAEPCGSSSSHEDLAKIRFAYITVIAWLPVVSFGSTLIGTRWAVHKKVLSPKF
jgi:hypothetical protein